MLYSCSPVRKHLSKRRRNDVDVAKMPISAPNFCRIRRNNSGAETGILVTPTSFQHRFDIFSTNHFSLGMMSAYTKISPTPRHSTLLRASVEGYKVYLKCSGLRDPGRQIPTILGSLPTSGSTVRTIPLPHPHPRF